MEEVRPLNLRITPRALAHLAAIEAYISRDRPFAAKRVGERLKASFDFLCRYPDAGHAGRRRKTLEWVTPRLPYVIVYRVAEGVLQVHGIYHGARQHRD